LHGSDRGGPGDLRITGQRAQFGKLLRPKLNKLRLERPDALLERIEPYGHLVGGAPFEITSDKLALCLFASVWNHRPPDSTVIIRLRDA
jgi:hypothetical protein